MDERARPLLEREVLADPLAQFRLWLEEARAAGTRAPEAVAVATASAEGRPSVRMVLAKLFDERGFVFFTGRESRKAGDLAANPWAAILFHWDALGRQVRIEGRVEEVAREEVDGYFRSRPRGAQIGAWASRQSATIGSRDELDAAVDALDRRFAGADVPVPPAWGGYRVVPAQYEFWQHRENRLHDRLRYVRDGGAWRIERLAP